MPPAKIGFDDYLLTHTLDEFNELPLIDLSDPIFEGLNDSYIRWKLEGESIVPNIGQFKCTDLGNGERFALREKDNIHFSDDAGWRYFDGTHWKRDQISEIPRRAAACIRNIYVEAANVKDDDRRKAIATWAVKSESAGKLTAMIDMSKLVPGLSLEPDKWDKNPWLLNLKNGTLDLQTLALLPHQKTDLISKVAPVDYDPAATAPLWASFLERIIPNAETRSFVQRAVGYSLTASIRERCFFILHGGGKNGKSTFLDTLRAMLGDYGCVTRAETIMVKQNQQSGNASPDLAALRGRRMVCASETEEGKKLAEGLIKEVTGNKTIRARMLYHEEFEFDATFKIWLAVNHLPRIKGTDEAIWDRVKKIPFNVRIPDDEQDKTLLDKLLMELPGILNWAIQGLTSWLQSGLGRADEVEKATADYRSDSDFIHSFFDDCCIMGETRSATKSELYDKYAEWAKKSGEYILSKRRFGIRMGELGFSDRKLKGWVWDGIALIGDSGSNIKEPWE